VLPLKILNTQKH